MQDRSFYIYAYFRTDGSPCYIGKGKGKRWLEHEETGRKRRNPRLVKLIEENAGTLPKSKLIEMLTAEEAGAVEMLLIKLIRRGRRGPLVNMTDGGDGGAGRVFTPATRAKLSSAMTLRMSDPEARKKISDRHKGKSGIGVGRPSDAWSEESRAKVSARCKGVPLSDQHRAKISASLKARKTCK